MMKIHLAISLLLAGLVWLLSLVTVSAQTGLVVSNADARFDRKWTMPTELSRVLDGVTARVITEYGDAMQRHGLQTPTDPLRSYLAAVARHLSFTYGDAGRTGTLAYPKGLLHDSIPPTVDVINKTVGNAGSSATLTWSTNEFAKSVVAYGTQAGVHEQSIAASDYARDHKMVLDGLMPATTYFFTITSVDRDDNSSTSSEATFATITEEKIYLPLVSR
jgi:hypothetical protein